MCSTDRYAQTPVSNGSRRWLLPALTQGEEREMFSDVLLTFEGYTCCDTASEDEDFFTFLLVSCQIRTGCGATVSRESQVDSLSTQQRSSRLDPHSFIIGFSLCPHLYIWGPLYFDTVRMLWEITVKRELLWSNFKFPFHSLLNPLPISLKIGSPCGLFWVPMFLKLAPFGPHLVIWGPIYFGFGSAVLGEILRSNSSWLGGGLVLNCQTDQLREVIEFELCQRIPINVSICQLVWSWIPLSLKCVNLPTCMELN